jgi:hypothetical protein
MQTEMSDTDLTVRAIAALQIRRGWRLSQNTPDGAKLAAWTAVMAGGRQWKNERELAAYLTVHYSYWIGHEPDADERRGIDAEARRIWTRQQSERVVPREGMACDDSDEAPGGFRTYVCAFAPCRRVMPEGTGTGTHCSEACEYHDAHKDAGAVALGDDDARFGA